MTKFSRDISSLKDTDMYSLILFSLFKLRDIPEYSTLSELVYIIDKDNLLKLCEYFGGLTVKIPTIEELENIVYMLVLYKYVYIDNLEFDKAIEQIGYKTTDIKKVKSDFKKMCKILDSYEFKGR